MSFVEKSSAAFGGVTRRLESLTDGLIITAGHPELQPAANPAVAALHHGRVPGGIPATEPTSPITEVVEHCELGLRRGLEATLGCGALPADAWEQALVPVRLGGFGLWGPATVHKAARLAALVNIREKALELGASPEHLRLDFEAAVNDMC